jgi:hypothetical protein
MVPPRFSDFLPSLLRLVFGWHQYEMFGERAGYERIYLTDLQSRVYARLEVNALLRATLVTEVATRRESITNALTFRAARRRITDNAATENNMEIWNGLAWFTEISITSRNRQELNNAVAAFSRIFTFGTRLGFNCRTITGAMYAVLLDDLGIHWKEDLTAESDLGVIMQNALGVTPHWNTADINKDRYDFAAIMEEETEFVETLKNITNELTEKSNIPLLKIFDEYLVNWAFMSTAPSYDIPGIGFVIIGDTEFSADFGYVYITNGFFISHTDGFSALIAENMETENNTVTAATWTLELNDGYGIKPYGDNFRVARR